MFGKKLDFRRFWIAEAITAAGSILSSGLNAASQARTNALNRQQAREAYQREAEAIREQNVYNSPSMQVARMKAAGLSPTLAYGASGELTGQQTDVPSYNPIPAEAPQIGDLGRQAMDIARYGLEFREQENRDKLARVDVALKNASAFLAWSEFDHNNLENEYLAKTMDLRIDTLEATNAKTWQEYVESSKRCEVSDAEVKQIEENVKLIKAKTDLTNEEKNRIITLLPKEVRQMDAETALAWVQSAEGKERIKLIGADILLTREETRFKRDENSRQESYLNIAGRNQNLNERSYELDVAWKSYQQKYQNSKLIVDTCIDIGKMAVGYAGLKNLGTGGKQPSPIWTPNGMSQFDTHWGR